MLPKINLKKTPMNNEKKSNDKKLKAIIIILLLLLVGSVGYNVLQKQSFQEQSEHNIKAMMGSIKVLIDKVE